MKSRLQSILQAAPGATPVYLEKTRWFDDVDDQPEQAIKEFEVKYQSYRADIQAELGQADFDDADSREEIDQWYPEAIRLSGWSRDGKTIYLALVQHDRESPIAIEMNCYTDEELSELKV